MLPLALLTAGAAVVGTYVVLGRTTDRRVASALAGVAAFAYAVFLLQAVRCVISATRSYLPVGTIALLGVAAAIAVAGASWYYDAVSRGDRAVGGLATASRSSTAANGRRKR